MTLVNNAFPLRSIYDMGSAAKKAIHANSLAANKQSDGWVVNISAGYRFASRAQHQIQICYSQYAKPLLQQEKANYKEIAETLINKQFEFMCALLRANTCKCIYFDAAFSDEQLAQIRVLQSCSQSELINTRMAYMFEQQRHA